MRRIKPLKKILLGVSSFFLLFIAGTQKVSAFWILAAGILAGVFGIKFVAGDLAERFVSYLATIIVGLITLITSVFLEIAGRLIEFAIKLNSGVADSSIVADGYEIALSVANIAIVVAIITVAFMVMLRRTAANQLLFRFIAVALVINFGYYIMTNLLIRPVDSITLQISDAINIHPTGGFGGTFGDPISGDKIDPSLVIESVIENQDEGDALSGFLLNLGISLARIIISASVSFILIITMFAYAFMFFARYVALSFFIILFPLAVIFWMFPNLKMGGENLWNQWFGGFTRWLLFGPVGLFFVWLAVKLMTDSNALRNVDGSEASFFVAIGNMMIVVGFMLGGLMVANKMSITGAGYAQGIVNKAGGWAKDFGIRRTKQQLQNIKTGALNTKFARKRIANMQTAKGFKGGLYRATGLKSAGRGLAGTAQRGEDYLKTNYKERYKDYAPYRIGQAFASAKNDAERLALLELGIEKGNYFEFPDFHKQVAGMEERGVFRKFGGQKAKIDLAKAGHAPEVLRAQHLGEFAYKEGDTDKDKRRKDEGLAAVHRRVYDQVQTSDYRSKIDDMIFADYTSPGERHGESEEDFKRFQGLHTEYIANERPEAARGIQNRVHASGAAAITGALIKRGKGLKDLYGMKNTELREHLADDTNWQKIREDLIDDAQLRINVSVEDSRTGIEGAVTSEAEIKRKLAAKEALTDKDKELRRIIEEVDAAGAPGFIKQIQAIQNAQMGALNIVTSGTTE